MKPKDKEINAEAERLNGAAFQLFVAGSYQKAREGYLNAVEKAPNWERPYLGLGQTYFFEAKPNLPEALKCFRRVVELSPEWPEGHHWLGTVQEKNGELEDAVKSFEQASRLAPSDTRPLISLGVCLTRLKRYDDAIRHLRHGIELKPHYGEASAHLFLADALIQSGQTDAACSEWKFIAQLPPTYPEYKSASKEAKKLLEIHGCAGLSKRRGKR